MTHGRGKHPDQAPYAHNVEHELARLELEVSQRARRVERVSAKGSGLRKVLAGLAALRARLWAKG